MLETGSELDRRFQKGWRSPRDGLRSSSQAKRRRASPPFWRRNGDPSARPRCRVSRVTASQHMYLLFATNAGGLAPTVTLLPMPTPLPHVAPARHTHSQRSPPPQPAAQSHHLPSEPASALVNRRTQHGPAREDCTPLHIHAVAAAPVGMARGPPCTSTPSPISHCQPARCTLAARLAWLRRPSGPSISRSMRVWRCPVRAAHAPRRTLTREALLTSCCWFWMVCCTRRRQQ